MTRRAWITSSMAAAAVATATAAWLVRPAPGVQVTTADVTSGAIDRRVIATGTVEAVTTVDVGTQVSGVVQALDADFNSSVHANDVIATLDPALYKAALDQAQATLVQARDGVAQLQTAVDDARIKLTRAEALAARQLIPQADLDAARIAIEEADADLQAGQAQQAQAAADVDRADLNLRHTVIRSPIDGVVVDREVDVGQTLAASLQSPVLFRIAADLRRMQVQVDVDEADVGGLRAGEPATFSVEAYPDQVFAGTVVEVRLQPVAEETTTATTAGSSTGPAATTLVATVVSYTAIVDVANPDERLKPGMTATVTLDGSRRDHAVRIPNAALSFRPPPDVLAAIHEADSAPVAGADDDTRGLARDVWRYDGRQFVRIPVRAGLADEGWTELMSGAVKPGDALVTNATLAPARVPAL